MITAQAHSIQIGWKFNGVRDFFGNSIAINSASELFGQEFDRQQSTYEKPKTDSMPVRQKTSGYLCDLIIQSMPAGGIGKAVIENTYYNGAKNYYASIMRSLAGNTQYLSAVNDLANSAKRVSAQNFTLTQQNEMTFTSGTVNLNNDSYSVNSQYGIVMDMNNAIPMTYSASNSVAYTVQKAEETNYQAEIRNEVALDARFDIFYDLDSRTRQNYTANITYESENFVLNMPTKISEQARYENINNNSSLSENTINYNNHTVENNLKKYSAAETKTENVMHGINFGEKLNPLSELEARLDIESRNNANAPNITVTLSNNTFNSNYSLLNENKETNLIALTETIANVNLNTYTFNESRKESLARENNAALQIEEYKKIVDNSLKNCSRLQMAYSESDGRILSEIVNNLEKPSSKLCAKLDLNLSEQAYAAYTDNKGEKQCAKLELNIKEGQSSYLLKEMGIEVFSDGHLTFLDGNGERQCAKMDLSIKEAGSTHYTTLGENGEKQCGKLGIDISISGKEYSVLGGGIDVSVSSEDNNKTLSYGVRGKDRKMIGGTYHGKANEIGMILAKEFEKRNVTLDLQLERNVVEGEQISGNENLYITGVLGFVHKFESNMRRYKNQNVIVDRDSISYRIRARRKSDGKEMDVSANTSLPTGDYTIDVVATIGKMDIDNRDMKTEIQKVNNNRNLGNGETAPNLYALERPCRGILKEAYALKDAAFLTDGESSVLNQFIGSLNGAGIESVIKTLEKTYEDGIEKGENVRYVKEIIGAFNQYLKLNPQAREEHLGVLLWEVDRNTGELISEPGYSKKGLDSVIKEGKLLVPIISELGVDLAKSRINLDKINYEKANAYRIAA